MLFFMLHNVFLAFQPVDKTLKKWLTCNYSAVLSRGAVNYAAQVGSDFGVYGWKPKVWPVKSKILSSTFLWFCTRWFWILSLVEFLKCDRSNESYWAVLSSDVHGDSNFWVCGWNPKVWTVKSKLLSSTFLWCCLLRLTFESVDEIMKCDHSNQGYWELLSCGAVYYSVKGDSNSWVCGKKILKCEHLNKNCWAVFPVLLIISTRWWPRKLITQSFPFFWYVLKFTPSSLVCSLNIFI